ncbi:MAG: 4-hydroxy-tetrahydrodipicolinate reductase [Bacteroidetes bacterium HGW-Bacteroidetes-8]|jgi:4-hydroxy-tetrahydrodipicolinate reductase|nr:MAG: 4-hydroxy-tetrahydrodipicolinate reductase [Bacteroidetes bacterium HGW-Bacteroidetes-8]
MEIVLSGYGKMGREIESVLKDTTHTIIAKSEDILSIDKRLTANSVCIDFSEPEAFLKNYRFIAENFKAAVVGTTGWNDAKDEVIASFRECQTTMIYASNFSLGVGILFKLCEIASRLCSNLGEYDPYIIEMHHKFKLDSPSGTAKSLKEIVTKESGHNVTIESVRSGFIPGIHRLGFESAQDRITIEHEAFSRRGFALGAVTAAEWSSELKGVFDFRDIIENKFTKILNYERD